MVPEILTHSFHPNARFDLGVWCYVMLAVVFNLKKKKKVQFCKLSMLKRQRKHYKAVWNTI